MKKVMFFINTLAGGGAEKVLVDLLGLMPKDKYQFTVITVEGGEYVKKIPEYVEYKQIVRFKNKRIAALINRIIQHLPYSLFAKLFLKENYDIEVAYLPGFPTHIIAKKKTDGKKITFIHGKVTKESMPSLRYKSLTDCYREHCGFDKVCVVSNNAKESLENAIGKLPNSMVLYNIIDVDCVRMKANEKCDEEFLTDGLKIVSLGRLTRIKGYERLIRAVSKLEREHSFEIWILGQGDEREKLETLIRELNVKSIKLLGFKSNPYSYLAKADLYLCSSYSEGYSTATFEAVALGLPVLTTDCSGTREILEDGKFGLITENSEEGIYDGLKKLLEDKELLKAYREEAIKCRKVNYTKEAIDGYMRLFDNI